MFYAPKLQLAGVVRRDEQLQENFNNLGFFKVRRKVWVLKRKVGWIYSRLGHIIDNTIHHPGVFVTVLKNARLISEYEEGYTKVAHMLSLCTITPS